MLPSSAAGDMRRVEWGSAKQANICRDEAAEHLRQERRVTSPPRWTQFSGGGDVMAGCCSRGERAMKLMKQFSAGPGWPGCRDYSAGDLAHRIGEIWI